MTESASKAFDQQVAASVALVDNMLRGRETGYRVEVTNDRWESSGPGQRITISGRAYTAISPKGRISGEWAVIKSGAGVTVKPVLDVNNEQYLVFVFKPHPAIRGWVLEFPSGGAKQINLNGMKVLETVTQAAARELEEETGYRAGSLDIIMRDMSFAPFRFDQSETVVAATQLTKGEQRLEYEETLMEVHMIPAKMLKDMLVHNVIKDFRTFAVASDHLLRQ